MAMVPGGPVGGPVRERRRALVLIAAAALAGMIEAEVHRALVTMLLGMTWEEWRRAFCSHAANHRALEGCGGRIRARRGRRSARRVGARLGTRKQPTFA